MFSENCTVFIQKVRLIVNTDFKQFVGYIELFVVHLISVVQRFSMDAGFRVESFIGF